MAHPVLKFLMTTKMPRHLDKSNKTHEQQTFEIKLFKSSIIDFNKAWVDKSTQLMSELNARNINIVNGVGQRCSVLEIMMIEIRTITNYELINELTNQIKGI